MYSMKNYTSAARKTNFFTKAKLAAIPLNAAKKKGKYNLDIFKDENLQHRCTEKTLVCFLLLRAIKQLN